MPRSESPFSGPEPTRPEDARPDTRLPEGSRSEPSRSVSVWPGLGLAGAAALIAVAINKQVPLVSALLVAILLGVVAAHTLSLTPRWQPGLAIAAKPVLRVGIVLLGLQLSFTQILDLGAGVILLVVAVVGLGVLITTMLGRWLGLSRALTLLIASGFSICGAAAVAAVEDECEADETETATAIGLVVVFGTAMIGVVPLLAGLLQLEGRAAGLLAGASTHEVAQVVAAAGILGGGALATAVVVKLARVLMLAPLIVFLRVQDRRQSAHGSGSVLSLVPLFVIGFVAAVSLRTFVDLPKTVLTAGSTLSVFLLAAAMFALGSGVHIGLLRRVGGRSVLLGALSTALVTGIAVIGALTLA